MSETFVLIFALLTQELGSVSLSAEFHSREACEEASEDLYEMHRGVDEPHNAYLHAKCYPKGEVEQN